MISAEPGNDLEVTGLYNNQPKTTLWNKWIFFEHFRVTWVPQSSHICCSGKARFLASFKEFEGSQGNFDSFVNRSHYFPLWKGDRDRWEIRLTVLNLQGSGAATEVSYLFKKMFKNVSVTLLRWNWTPNAPLSTRMNLHWKTNPVCH